VRTVGVVMLVQVRVAVFLGRGVRNTAPLRACMAAVVRSAGMYAAGGLRDIVRDQETLRGPDAFNFASVYR
jgi:hypothetical protein